MTGDRGAMGVELEPPRLDKRQGGRAVRICGVWVTGGSGAARSSGGRWSGELLYALMG